MNKAIFIKNVDGSSADQRLYKVEPPMTRIEYDWENDKEMPISVDYVVVSAATVMFSGDETYIFHADKHGNIVYWGEMDGSFKGERNHVQALSYAGYTIETPLKKFAAQWLKDSLAD